MDLKIFEPQLPHQIVDYQGDLNVRGVASRSDLVEIALPELAKTPVSGVLAAPNRPHLIALERRAELADVLRGESRKGNCQIEAEGHVATAVIGKSVDKFVRFGSALSEENVCILQGRCFDGCITKGAVDLANIVNEPLARDHKLRQKIAEPFKRPWLNQGHVRPRILKTSIPMEWNCGVCLD